MMRRLTLIGTALAILVVLTPEAADAHVSSVSATAVCEPDGSNQLITWTIVNEYPDPAVLSTFVLSPAVAGTKLPSSVVAERDHKPGTVTLQYRLPVGPGKITIQYVGEWPDQFRKTFRGTTNGVASCPTPAAVPTTPPPTLPVTGGRPTVIVGAAGAFLAIGGVLLLLGRRGRRTTTAHNGGIR